MPNYNTLESIRCIACDCEIKTLTSKHSRKDMCAVCNTIVNAMVKDLLGSNTVEDVLDVLPDNSSIMEE